jgi:hypothetical protein
MMETLSKAIQSCPPDLISKLVKIFEGHTEAIEKLGKEEESALRAAKIAYHNEQIDKIKPHIPLETGRTGASSVSTQAPGLAGGQLEKVDVDQETHTVTMGDGTKQKVVVNVTDREGNRLSDDAIKKEVRTKARQLSMHEAQEGVKKDPSKRQQELVIGTSPRKGTATTASRRPKPTEVGTQRAEFRRSKLKTKEAEEQKQIDKIKSTGKAGAIKTGTSKGKHKFTVVLEDGSIHRGRVSGGGDADKRAISRAREMLEADKLEGKIGEQHLLVPLASREQEELAAREEAETDKSLDNLFLLHFSHLLSPSEYRRAIIDQHTEAGRTESSINKVFEDKLKELYNSGKGYKDNKNKDKIKELKEQNRKAIAEFRDVPSKLGTYDKYRNTYKKKLDSLSKDKDKNKDKIKELKEQNRNVMAEFRDASNRTKIESKRKRVYKQELRKLQEREESKAVVGLKSQRQRAIDEFRDSISKRKIDSEHGRIVARALREGKEGIPKRSLEHHGLERDLDSQINKIKKELKNKGLDQLTLFGAPEVKISEKDSNKLYRNKLAASRKLYKDKLAALDTKDKDYESKVKSLAKEEREHNAPIRKQRRKEYLTNQLKILEGKRRAKSEKEKSFKQMKEVGVPEEDIERFRRRSAKGSELWVDDPEHRINRIPKDVEEHYSKRVDPSDSISSEEKVSKQRKKKDHLQIPDFPDFEEGELKAELFEREPKVTPRESESEKDRSGETKRSELRKKEIRDEVTGEMRKLNDEEVEDALDEWAFGRGAKRGETSVEDKNLNNLKKWVDDFRSALLVHRSALFKKYGYASPSKRDEKSAEFKVLLRHMEKEEDRVKESVSSLMKERNPDVFDVLSKEGKDSITELLKKSDTSRLDLRGVNFMLGLFLNSNLFKSETLNEERKRAYFKHSFGEDTPGVSGGNTPTEEEKEDETKKSLNLGFYIRC